MTFPALIGLKLEQLATEAVAQGVVVVVAAAFVGEYGVVAEGYFALQAKKSWYPLRFYRRA